MPSSPARPRDNAGEGHGDGIRDTTSVIADDNNDGYTLARDGDEEARRVVELMDRDLSSDQALTEAVEALSAHRVTRMAWDIAYRWADDAVETLAPLPNSTVKSALASFAQAVVHRES